MPDLPRYPVAWSVDARVPDEVRALIAKLITMPIGDGDAKECREIAVRVNAMLHNPPPGKHAIPTD
jgi:hypothetical protein